MTRLNSVLTTADMPLAELCAARLDGDLVAIDECFRPVDLPEFDWHRSAAIASLAPAHTIVEQFSAAWVHGIVLEPPSVHQFCVAAGNSLPRFPGKRITVREVTIAKDEIVLVGGTAITTPLRTALDIIRLSPVFESHDHNVIVGLIDLAGMKSSDFADLVSQLPSIAHKRRALKRAVTLSGTHAIDVIDGVNAPHGVEHAIKVRRVAHFEYETAQRQSVVRRRYRRRQNVHVILGEHARYIRKQPGTVKSLDLNLNEKNAL
jgi:hypothetical protein